MPVATRGPSAEAQPTPAHRQSRTFSGLRGGRWSRRRICGQDFFELSSLVGSGNQGHSRTTVAATGHSVWRRKICGVSTGPQNRSRNRCPIPTVKTAYRHFRGGFDGRGSQRRCGWSGFACRPAGARPDGVGQGHGRGGRRRTRACVLLTLLDSVSHSCVPQMCHWTFEAALLLTSESSPWGSTWVRSKTQLARYSKGRGSPR